MSLSSASVQYPEERRLATVLFADVHGFTTLAERLDYETISDFIKGVWLKLDTIIDAHGGYIDKHIGDAVMAVWGAPFTGENDAEQAVAAALALQKALDVYIESSELPAAQELQIRVGINSGPVLAGYVGLRREYTVMGDTVNVANRLENSADPGTVVISESTYRLIRGAFQVRRIPEPLHLRGKTEPIQAYLVEGTAPQPGRMRYRGADSLETHMVGREAELNRLLVLYDQAMHASTPQLVLVSGDVGIGKSRLLMEFSNQLEVSEQVVTLIASRALAQISQVPYYLWKSIWQLYFSLQESDPLEVSRDKFLQAVQRVWGNQLGPASGVEAAHLIGSLIGISWPDSPFLARFDGNPDGRVRHAYALTRELLRRMSSNRPTALLFDDLQWADGGSLDLLNYILTPTEQALPLLVVASSRPEFIRHNPRWANRGSVIELGSLSVNADIVAAAYPDVRDVSHEVLTELAKQTDGNPYFLEEMIKYLLTSGMLHEELTEQQILGRLRTQPPESLRIMLQARLDKLSPEARSVALLASVVGRVFWVGAVRAEVRVADDMGTGLLKSYPLGVVDRVIQDSLRQLIRAELAFPKANTSFSMEQEYIFKHMLLRDVAYSLLPHKNRPRYHLAVAQWMSDHDTPEFKVMAANHYELGGMLMDAARYYEAAAELALLSGAPHQAEEMLFHARQLRSKIKKPL